MRAETFGAQARYWWRRILGITSAQTEVPRSERGAQVMLLLSVALPTTAFFAFFNFVHDYILLAVLEIVVVAVLLPFVWLSRIDRYVPAAQWATMVMSTMIFSALALAGGVEGTGVYWANIFPFVAFYVTGQRGGWRWAGIFLAVVLTAVLLHVRGLVTLPHTGHQLTHYVASLIFYTFIAAVFNAIREGYEEELEMRVHERTRQAEEALAEARQSEVRYRRLVDNLREHFIFTFGSDGVVTYVSPTVTRILGYAPEECLRHFSAFFTDAGENQVAFPRAEMALAGDQPPPAELELFRKDGDRRWLEVVVNPVVDEASGEVVSVEGIAHDVTRRRAMEEEKRAIEEKMAESQRLEALGVLAGGIAHDYNNLVSVIMMNTALLERSLGEHADAGQFLERIHLAADRAKGLCRELLAYAGKGATFVAPVDLSELIRDMNRMLAVSVDRRVALECNLADDLPPVEADPAQIQQVVMNLIMNASDAIDGRDGEIRIVTRCVTVGPREVRACLSGEFLPPGDYVRLEVRDTGCGMDEQTQSRLFEPFFTTKATGRGLGMSAVLGIVRSHEGDICLSSRVGEGSAFTLLFPAGEGEVEAAAPLSGPERPERHDGYVLVVDDEEELRDSVARVLNDAGYRTLAAADGAEGVARFREHRDDIDAVLLDMEMPRMGGADACREIRRLDADVPVVITSGFGEEEMLARVQREGVGAFLQKPFDPDELLAALAAALRRPKGSPSDPSDRSR